MKTDVILGMPAGGLKKADVVLAGQNRLSRSVLSESSVLLGEADVRDVISEELPEEEDDDDDDEGAEDRGAD